MSRILIADSADGAANLRRILAGDHELVVAGSMHEAIDALQMQSFDLIIVGVHFDDSTMFRLLAAIKQIPQNAEKLIICFCTRDTEMTRTMHEALDFACRMLGAWVYLDQHDYSVHQDPDSELRRVIGRCVTHQDREEAMVQRIDIHQQRAEIQRLRLALESEEWSREVKDQLADLRSQLSSLLLELDRTYTDNAAQQQAIRTSRDLHDRVPDNMTNAENEMTAREMRQSNEELEQSREEDQIVDREQA